MKGIAWNPWHGCHKVSEGCRNCFVYYLDSVRKKNTNIITKSQTNFNYPLKKNRQGDYKIPFGNQVGTCFTSDFFIEEADQWRLEVWDMIRRRPDLEFLIPTKRISRFMDCIPSDWGNGWDNVFIAVSVENQKTVDERLPYLIKAPIKKKAIFVAPILEEVDIEIYLNSGDIDLVSVSGESYKNARECDFNWILHIKNQCEENNTKFDFHQTGTNFIYNGKNYSIPHNKEYSQAKKAFK